MKLSTIFAGAMLALGVSAAPYETLTLTHGTVTTVTVTQTYTKYVPTKVTITQTITKATKVHTTVSETITKYKIKTTKVCPPSYSPTVSVYGNVAPHPVARAQAAEPLYAKEFA